MMKEPREIEILDHLLFGRLRRTVFSLSSAWSVVIWICKYYLYLR